MKGFIGPQRSQWETDFAGVIWFRAYNADRVQAPCSASDAAALPKLWEAWGAIAEKSAKKYDLPLEWILAIMLAESRGNASAKSPAGAIGLMQVMPLNAGGRNLENPAENLDAACDLLRRMQDHKKGPWDLLELSSQYNAGPAPTGGPKFSIQYDFGLVNGVGPSKLPDGVIYQSPYLRQIAGACNWLLQHPAPPGASPPIPNLPVDPLAQNQPASVGQGLLLLLVGGLGLYLATRKRQTVHRR